MTPNRLPREDEAMRVERNAAALQPVGLRVRADEEKHMAYRPSLLDTAAAIPPRHGSEVVRSFAVQLRQFGMGMQQNVLRGSDAVDQIARHACGESRTADEQMNLCGMTGQKYGGLASRIAAAHQ